MAEEASRIVRPDEPESEAASAYPTVPGVDLLEVHAHDRVSPGEPRCDVETAAPTSHTF
jgi:hypothetical protein